MQDKQANDFYERIVEGTEYTRKIELSHESGETLEGVEMHPVDKQTLADVIQALPEDMFSAVEAADSPEEAEEMLEGSGAGMSLSSMSSDTVDAFEELVAESLSHPAYTNTQMEQVVQALGFAKLFELGGEIIDMSFAEGGAIEDFREPE